MKYRYQEIGVRSGNIVEIPDGDEIFDPISTVRIKFGTYETATIIAWFERVEKEDL